MTDAPRPLTTAQRLEDLRERDAAAVSAAADLAVQKQHARGKGTARERIEDLLDDGSFVETLKGWQSGWFYITEPRNANWAAAPEFRSRIPMWLTYWEKKGLA